MTRDASAPVSVVIADDQHTVRDALSAILSSFDDVVVVGAAQDGAGAVALAECYDADVVLMDLRMPGIGGIEATRELHLTCPATAVVVMTTYEDEVTIGAALAAGACSYFMKTASTQDIRLAVRSAVINGSRQ